MQTVYEIVQDDMPLDVPLFTDLGRAQHELKLIVDEGLKEAKLNYHSDAFIHSEPSQYQFVVGDVQYIMVSNGLLEYSSFGIYSREVNTATLGDSHS